MNQNHYIYGGKTINGSFITVGNAEIQGDINTHAHQIFNTFEFYGYQNASIKYLRVPNLQSATQLAELFAREIESNPAYNKVSPNDKYYRYLMQPQDLQGSQIFEDLDALAKIFRFAVVVVRDN